jgi:hypothetical protein
VTRLLVELLTAGKTVRMRVSGHSMTPCVRAGDVVTLAPLRGREPRLGEVVALEAADGRLLLHRLVGWRRGRALTRGDLAPATDAPVPRTALLGLVTQIERRTRLVRFGLGGERILLAGLTRAGLLRLAARVREGLRRGRGPRAPRAGRP